MLYNALYMYYKYVSFTFPLPKRISIFRQRDFPLSLINYKKERI
ncbi:hypothetical protein BN890_46910 [Bacteroides xylanisolvens SD CC 1b]|uniref:Uncharacterized protein n=1 Tax=Bacteroides xylanisolvens SD CC 1b TaxID=702447 RepID=W6PBE6_9BACE|nr:hypothetical protein BN890_46910 [Bacteroides xylanisolvens SD CC 1b]